MNAIRAVATLPPLPRDVVRTIWKDVKFAASVLCVSHKPDLGWAPKAYKEREIPVPAKLIRCLKKLQASSKGMSTHITNQRRDAGRDWIFLTAAKRLLNERG